ncbi:MAG: hypothetical protein QNJ98_05470 [Planctomycetota bacterium]|nr:hypothetical protein [Planctomycetota bacterium]
MRRPMGRLFPLAALLACLGVAVAGCGGSSGGGGTTPGGVTVGPTSAMDHTNIVLKDRFGQPITLTSKEPYSPNETCGPCHDVVMMANGYHFQQGRTTAAGTIQTRDDFFSDGRTWLKSDGMYGKW